MESDEQQGSAAQESRDLSRRNALRAGVAVGVGVAAWSGASITSFGGTPAYAQTSTQTPQVLDIGGGCRNTTQAGCNPFGYQSAEFTPPAGFTITDVGSNVCCEEETPGTFTFTTPNMQCRLTFSFFTQCEQGTGQLIARMYFPSQFSASPSPLGFFFECPDLIISPFPPSTQYIITAFCFVGATPPGSTFPP